MRILLTNDDGIYAEGIWAAYKELKKVGEVIVVAPDSERSSVGHGITLSHPIYFKKVTRHGEFFGYGISGMPADCVKFATNVILKEKPDLVVSGINLGGNEGCSAFYSGTVAGAREGALMRIPSMAVSLDTFASPDFSYAAKLTANFAKKIYKHSMPKGSFISVNVPAVAKSKIQGIRVTSQGQEPIHGTFKKRKDPNGRTYYWLTGKLVSKRNDLNVDIYALRHRYVTITPFHCDLTDYNFRNDLQAWFK